MQPTFLTLPDAVAREAAARFVALAEVAIAERGKFVVALAGGSTPERLYKILATRTLDWAKITVFFSDDRFVARTSRHSNGGTCTVLLDEAASS